MPMELYSPSVNKQEAVVEFEVVEEKLPTIEQIKKFGREFVGRVVEPLSTSSSTEKMSDDQRYHTGNAMAETAIRFTQY